MFNMNLISSINFIQFFGSVHVKICNVIEELLSKEILKYTDVDKCKELNNKKQINIVYYISEFSLR